MTVVNFKAKKIFFDDKRILRFVNKAQATALRRFGAITRQDMKKSIKRKAPTAGQLQRSVSPDPRKAKRALRTIARRRAARSLPGQPPFSHVRNDRAGLRDIRFAFDTVRRSVVISTPDRDWETER